tara:strand:+ start:301 stop:519 length:219 start_codon:yes stop_codon:yes gene_type:complete
VTALDGASKLYERAYCAQDLIRVASDYIVGTKNDDETLFNLEHARTVVSDERLIMAYVLSKLRLHVDRTLGV